MSFLDSIDWNPTHGFIAQDFSIPLNWALGMPWADLGGLDLSINPQTAIAGNIQMLQQQDLNNITWDPRGNVTFKEGVVPVAEGVGIAVATIYTGGTAGIILGAGLAAGAKPMNTALGMQGEGFAANYFPLIGSLAGSAVNVVSMLGAAPAVAADGAAVGGASSATAGGAGASATTGSNALTSAIATGKGYYAAATPYLAAGGALVKAVQSTQTQPVPTKPSTTQAAPAGMSFNTAPQAAMTGVTMAVGLGLLLLLMKKK